ncbi:RDD family protein [Ferrimonas sp. SCSIO 43195]|uniref:RDD family protein n=1 Tax=Ferrimonas sp. SCSIO 43195 TaxID=2822844 RepID=UPI002074DC21|nr:RDD family protein [Ferrimonas sp. SCSIO 43195]USD38020.1 RDD family protein [Ferrimonas sp. SCSIO 43195]
MHPHANAPRASLKRRLATLLYDSLLGLAVYMAFGAVFFMLFGALVSQGVISNPEQQHAIDILQSSPGWTLANEGFKWGGVMLFFSYFWQKSGQTIGMRAWRLKLQNIDGSLISWHQALIRLITSGFGLMALTMVFSDDKRSLHDKWSHTELVELSIEQNRARLGQ